MNIKLTDTDKIKVTEADDIFGIMQRILLRDNKIDREKEHFWVVGLNAGNFISYIELISLGTVTDTLVEPMHVFRVAVQKGAVRVILVHNHPSGKMKASANDEDVTDRLIQVGRIIKIDVMDHLIISPTSYISFAQMGLMDKLMKSTKYVPTYLLIEQIRKEEKAIQQELLKVEKEKIKAERDKAKLAQSQLNKAISYLLEQKLTAEEISKILNVTVKEVEKVKSK